MTLDVSIVIAAHGLSQSLGRCLQALLGQLPGRKAEVILVVSGAGPSASEWLAEHRFPVILIELAGAQNLARMRLAGIRRAGGSIIALLDPFSIVRQGWLDELISVHSRRPAPAIGGAVGLYGRPGLAGRAIYLNEYGGFAPPLESGPAEVLPGCNVSYKRSAWEVVPVEGEDRPGFWKTFVNARLIRERHPLWLDGDLIVDLDKQIPFMDFLGTRFLHGRCYAGMRRVRMPLIERLLRSAGAPILPIVFLWRLARTCLRAGTARYLFLATLPLQILLFTSWALGEMAGYLAGAGASCDRLIY